MPILLEFCAKPVCPKCGAKGPGDNGIHRAFHEKGECAFPHTCPPFEHEGPTIKGEHHYLYCRGCGYSWRTKVKP